MLNHQRVRVLPQIQLSNHALGGDECFAGIPHAELVLERKQLGELTHEQDDASEKTSS